MSPVGNLLLMLSLISGCIADDETDKVEPASDFPIAKNMAEVRKTLEETVMNALKAGASAAIQYAVRAEGFNGTVGGDTDSNTTYSSDDALPEEADWLTEDPLKALVGAIGSLTSPTDKPSVTDPDSRQNKTKSGMPSLDIRALQVLAHRSTSSQSRKLTGALPDLGSFVSALTDASHSITNVGSTIRLLGNGFSNVGSTLPAMLSGLSNPLMDISNLIHDTSNAIGSAGRSLGSLATNVLFFGSTVTNIGMVLNTSVPFLQGLLNSLPDTTALSTPRALSASQFPLLPVLPGVAQPPIVSRGPLLPGGSAPKSPLNSYIESMHVLVETLGNITRILTPLGDNLLGLSNVFQAIDGPVEAIPVLSQLKSNMSDIASTVSQAGRQLGGIYSVLQFLRNPLANYGLLQNRQLQVVDSIEKIGNWSAKAADVSHSLGNLTKADQTAYQRAISQTKELLTELEAVHIATGQAGIAVQSTESLLGVLLDIQKRGLTTRSSKLLTECGNKLGVSLESLGISQDTLSGFKTFVAPSPQVTNLRREK